MNLKWLVILLIILLSFPLVFASEVNVEVRVVKFVRAGVGALITIVLYGSILYYFKSFSTMTLKEYVIFLIIGTIVVVLLIIAINSLMVIYYG